MKNEYYSMKKRLLAVILSLMMIFQMLPAGALAETGQITSEPTRANFKWQVRFHDQDGEVIKKWQVKNDEPIGRLPKTIARKGYLAYWAVGIPNEGEQGTVWTPGERITSSYVVTKDLDIVPDYDAIDFTYTFDTPEEKEYTVQFTSNGEVIETRQVAEGKAIGEFPEAPVREGYTFNHWVIVGRDGSVLYLRLPCNEPAGLWKRLVHFCEGA